MPYEKAEIKKKPVVITDVTIKPFGQSLSYMLDTNGGKFSFFNKKIDGSETKAFAQFTKFNFKKGDSVEVAYTEKVSDKINGYTGKPYVNYNVMYFVTADENTPSTPKVEQNVHNTMYPGIPTIQLEQEEPVKNDYLLMINNLSARLSVVEKFLDIPRLDENGEEKLNLTDVPF